MNSPWPGTDGGLWLVGGEGLPVPASNKKVIKCAAHLAHRPKQHANFRGNSKHFRHLACHPHSGLAAEALIFTGLECQHHDNSKLTQLLTIAWGW